MLPRRPKDGHKGSFGHVLVIAGSKGFTGAVHLASGGASRSGAGLVTVAVPQSIVPIVAPSCVEAMWIGLPACKAESIGADAVAPALVAAQGKNAVVIGPGISTQDETRRFVLEFVKTCKVPMVIDADALNNLSINPGILTNALAPIVITPHPGEMARLAGTTSEQVQRDRESIARQFSARYNVLVVLKGYRTVVASPDGQCFINPTGNSGMATGGSGDILGGVIAGLMAQGLSARDAACVGAYAHGLAGDIAANDTSARGMIAPDILSALPRAWRTIEGN